MTGAAASLILRSVEIDDVICNGKRVTIIAQARDVVDTDCCLRAMIFILAFRHWFETVEYLRRKWPDQKRTNPESPGVAFKSKCFGADVGSALRSSQIVVQYAGSMGSCAKARRE